LESALEGLQVHLLFDMSRSYVP